MTAAIVWFRNDLRLSDNPALTAALKQTGRVIAVYIYAPHEAGQWLPGAASNWWLHHSLAQLDASLRKRGNALHIATGDSFQQLYLLCRKHRITHIHASHLVEPVLRRRDIQLQHQLAAESIHLQLHHSATLVAPDTIVKQDGDPYRMFTPYWRRLYDFYQATKPLPAPAKIPALAKAGTSLILKDLQLLPSIAWDSGFHAHCTPGEKHALKRLQTFRHAGLNGYASERDRPDQEGTSRLSPHLHFGELSPRQVWWSLHTAVHEGLATDRQMESYLREIGWREFAYYVLHHFPYTTDKPMDKRFENFPWTRRKAALLRTWQQGKTGIPIVDAGMRQLWHTGWMHNRVRMIVASFLTKNCLIDWREGARWFWDTLVDADLASNTLGWQWTAGCGVDAAPYFRIFNPLRQGEKFDPQGHYVKTWVPELAGVDRKHIHQPWKQPRDLFAGGQRKGTYPDPVVDLAQSRAAALEAFASLR